MKKGFKPSEKGLYGPGVYLTNTRKMACKYGRCYGQENDMVRKLTYLFVNKVKRTDAHKSPRKFDEPFEEYLTKEPIVQTFYPETKELVAVEDCGESKFDSNNNKTIQGTFQKVNPNIYYWLIMM